MRVQPLPGASEVEQRICTMAEQAAEEIFALMGLVQGGRFRLQTAKPVDPEHGESYLDTGYTPWRLYTYSAATKTWHYLAYTT
jgi:hypothetical protein